LIKQLYLVHPDIINGKKGEIEKEEGWPKKLHEWIKIKDKWENYKD
jgi:hypothetical protein